MFFARQLRMKLVIGIVLCALAALSGPAQTWTADNGNGTFTNPLFFDEFSDSDMIRVGEDYYLTGTTMHAMPGLPVLHSLDLVNWEFLPGRKKSNMKRLMSFLPPVSPRQSSPPNLTHDPSASFAGSSTARPISVRPSPTDRCVDFSSDQTARSMHLRLFSPGPGS